QGKPATSQSIFSGLFTIHLIASLFGTGIFLAVLWADDSLSVTTPMLLLGCLSILLPSFTAEWYLQGIEAFRFITLRTVVLRIFGLAAIFLFVRNKTDFSTYYAIIVGTQFCATLFNIYKIGHGHMQMNKFSSIKQHLTPLFNFFLTSSIISIYVFFDVIILSFFSSDREVGYYATAIKIVKLSLLLVLSLNAILFPRISYLSTEQRFVYIRSLIQKSLAFVVVVTVPLAFVFFLLAPQIVFVLAGPDFTESIPLIRLLALLPIFIGLSNLFAYQILTPLAKEKKLLLSVVFACCCSGILQLILTQLYSARGTAVATLATEAIVTCLLGYFGFKTMSFVFPWKTTLHSILCCLPLVGLVIACTTIITNPLLLLIITIPGGIVVYTILQIFIFKNALFLQAWELVRSTVSRGGFYRA
ncbi:MAG: polysaccharide biosynthesis C-terminal domain-containing protein, partial [Chitinophagaceae bacterium]